MQKHEKVIGVIVGGIILLLLIYAFYSKRLEQPNFNKSQMSGSIYRSQNLDFTVVIASYFDIKENLTYVDFMTNDEKMTVSRIATNFENIQTYINDFDTTRTIAVSEENKVTIDRYDGVLRIEKFSSGPVSEEKAYMVYINGWVYSISTSSRNLYDELEEISTSFRYIP